MGGAASGAIRPQREAKMGAIPDTMQLAGCTAVNSVEGSVTLLSRLDLCPGGE